VKNVAIVNTV